MVLVKSSLIDVPLGSASDGAVLMNDTSLSLTVSSTGT